MSNKGTSGIYPHFLHNDGKLQQLQTQRAVGAEHYNMTPILWIREN